MGRPKLDFGRALILLDDLGSQSLPHQSLLKWSARMVGEVELQVHAILATMSFRKEPNCNFLTSTCL